MAGLPHRLDMVSAPPSPELQKYAECPMEPTVSNRPWVSGIDYKELVPIALCDGRVAYGHVVAHSSDPSASDLDH